VGIVMKRLTVPALAPRAVFALALALHAGFALALLTGGNRPAAAAREDGRDRPDDTPTAAQITACAPDAQRFCLQHLGNREATRACMIAHKKQLSETCKAAFR
jgi:hypothetical protein